MADLVFKLAEDFFSGLRSDEDLNNELMRFSRKVLFRVLDGKDFGVEIHQGNITLSTEPILDPDLELEADSETFRQLFKGEISPGQAWADEKLWFGGPDEGWSDTSKPDYPWLTRIIFKHQQNMRG